VQSLTKIGLSRFCTQPRHIARENLKPDAGLELDHLSGIGIENRVICRAIGFQLLVSFKIL